MGFYSLEMSAEQLAARILSEASEVPSEQIRRGDMTEAEFRRFVEAAGFLGRLLAAPIDAGYQPDRNVDLVRRLKAEARS